MMRFFRPPNSVQDVSISCLDLPQIQVRFPRFAKNCPDAGRSSLGHLDEDAFVFV